MQNRKKLLDSAIVYLLCAALILLVSFFLSSKLGIASQIVTEILLFAVPFLFIKYRNEKITERFNLKALPARNVFGAVFLTVGAVAASSALLSIMGIFFDGVNEIDSGIDTLIAQNSNVTVIIAIIVLPAICEELLFRGYIQSAFSSFKPWIQIGLVGILFGLMHFDIYKILPCAVIGCAFAYITYITGSILPTIICHLLNNAYSVVTRSNSAATTGEDVYEMIFKPTSSIFIATAMLGVAFIFGYLGVKSLTGKRFKKPYGLISTLIAIGVIIGSVLLMVNNEFSTEVQMESANGEYTKTVTLDSDRLVAVLVSGITSDEKAVYISVTDEDGSAVASGNNTLSIITPLEKGEYTLTVSADAEDAELEISTAISKGPKVVKISNENK